jgi:WD domain, G-beta repeat
MVVLPSVRQTIETLAYSPDGRWLAVGGSNEKAGLRIWNVANQTPFDEQPPERAGVYQLQWYADRPLKLVVGFRAVGLHVYAFNGRNLELLQRADKLLVDATEPKTLWYTNRDGQRSSFFLESTLRPDGQLWPIWRDQLGGGWGLIARALDKKRFVSAEYHYVDDNLRGAVVILVRSRKEGAVLHHFPFPHKTLDAMAASPNGKFVAFANRKSIQIWRGSSGYEFVTELKPDNRRQYTSIAFHPTGRFLAATGNDGTVQFFETSSWQRTHTFDWNIGRMRCLAFSPDDLSIAAGGDTGDVVIWDIEP